MSVRNLRSRQRRGLPCSALYLRSTQMLCQVSQRVTMVQQLTRRQWISYHISSLSTIQPLNGSMERTTRKSPRFTLASHLESWHFLKTTCARRLSSVKTVSCTLPLLTRRTSRVRCKGLKRNDSTTWLNSFRTFLASRLSRGRQRLDSHSYSNAESTPEDRQFTQRARLLIRYSSCSKGNLS